MSTSRGLWVSLALTLTMLGLPACGGRPTDLPARYELSVKKPFGDWPQVMRPVLLLADNQTQHLYGDPFWMRTDLATVMAHTAIRPVQLDLYGQDLLKWVIAQNRKDHHGGNYPIIHLGDGLNFSCQVEMDRFMGNMTSVQGQWAMAPGNHDGYFFGTFGRSTDWEAACRNGGGPVNRSAFLRRYLQTIGEKYGVPVASASSEWQRPAPAPVPGDSGFYDGVAWSIDGVWPWHSYVVQLLNVTQQPPQGMPVVPVYVVLLDTSEFAKEPVLETREQGQYDAGSVGSLLDDQVYAVKKLVRARTQPGAPAPLLVLMGHHPYHALTPDSRERLDSLMTDLPAVTYVSAHTHSAQYFVNAGKTTTWLELNLGSILDWSPEFRLFSMDLTPEQKVQIDTPQHKLTDEIAQYGRQGNSPWEAKPDEPRYYLSFYDLPQKLSGRDMQLKLMQTELAELSHSITLFPTLTSTFWPKDPANAEGTTSTDDQVQALIAKYSKSTQLEGVTLLAQQLQTFDEVRQTDTPSADGTIKSNSHAAYRLWQAMRASEEMKLRARIPDSNQQYFVFRRDGK